MWEQLKRIIKPNGAIVMTASQPFTTTLIASNMKMFKYCWVWQKSRVGHFAQAPYRPLTVVEDVVVFSYGGTSKNAKNRMVYNPQGIQDCEKICRGKGHSDHRPSNVTQKDYTQTKTGYPKQIIEFKSDQATLHPTQKPVALGQYLIRTYTNPGEVVLDFTAGSGSFGVAAVLEGRGFIGIEKEQKYYDIMVDRIKKAQKEFAA
jgi:site-specific DNA-methyltransferase (adenine-specific)